jgi:hypothetical protein
MSANSSASIPVVTHAMHWVAGVLGTAIAVIRGVRNWGTRARVSITTSADLGRPHHVVWFHSALVARTCRRPR